MVRRRFFSAVSNHGPRGHPRATASPLSRETHASAAQERRRCMLLRMRVYPGAKQNHCLGPLFLFRSPCDEAIQPACASLDCFASLAMTLTGRAETREFVIARSPCDEAIQS